MAKQKRNQTAADKRAPWRNPDGTLLSPGRLKQRSKKWSLQTWLAFSESLESKLSRESFISQKAIEDELIEKTYEIDECLEGQKDFSTLHMAIRSLTRLERLVIENIFWSGQTVRETAEKLRIPRSTAQNLKSRAFQKLYAKLWDTSPLMRGGSKFLLSSRDKKHAA